MSTIVGNFHVAGTLSASAVTLPSGVVLNAQVASNAGINATKIITRLQIPFYIPGKYSDDAPIAKTWPLHVMHAAGTTVAFKAGSVTADTSTGVLTVDLKKNGTTVLGAVITLDNGNTDMVVEAGSITDATLSAGDLLEITTIVSVAIVDMAGLYGYVAIDADPQ